MISRLRLKRKMLSGRLVYGLVAMGIFVSLAASTVAAKDESVDEMKARLVSTSGQDRIRLCIEIADRQLSAADKSYSTDDVASAQTALADVILFSEQARDASIQAGKRQKQTEISVRKMVHKLGDVKRTVTRDEQAAVQNVIDRLQRVRDDLLTAMFPKK